MQMPFLEKLMKLIQSLNETWKSKWIVVWNLILTSFLIFKIQCKWCHLKNPTWFISIQMSDVVKHEAEKTRELKKEGQNKYIWVFLKIIIYTLMKNEAESRPVAGPVHRHIRWTGRCSRCTSASSPGGPCSAGTTAGSKQLPLSL